MNFEALAELVADAVVMAFFALRSPAALGIGAPTR